jgi:hypothetical protein
MSFPLPSTSTSPLQQEVNDIYSSIAFEFARINASYNQINNTIYNNDLGASPAQVFTLLGVNGLGAIQWLSTLATFISTVGGSIPAAVIPSTIYLTYDSTGVITFHPNITLPGTGGTITPG